MCVSEYRGWWLAVRAAGATATRQMVPNTNNTGQLNIVSHLSANRSQQPEKWQQSVGRPSLHSPDIPNFYAAQIDCIKLIRAMRYIGLVQKYRWLDLVLPCWTTVSVSPILFTLVLPGI